MKFQKGHKFAKGGKREGAGRPPSKNTVIKRLLDKHPNAYEELLSQEYDKAIKGNSESARYVMDRLRGRPHQSIDQRLKGSLDMTADELLQAEDQARLESTKLLENVDYKLLPEGEDDILKGKEG